MSLISKTFLNAKVQAFRHPLVAPPPIGFNGGPVLDAEPADAPLRHCRYGIPADRFIENLAFPDPMRGSFRYAGPIYPHFGHFLSEMSHRFLPSLRADARGAWLFASTINDSQFATYAKFPEFVKDILKYFKIDASDVAVLNTDCLVERLFVSQPGSNFGAVPDHDYLLDLRMYCQETLDVFVDDNKQRNKIYVSRRQLPIAGGFLGERYLESLLEEEGVEIICPENYSFLNQMDIYRKAETIIFPEGSACHGTELLGTEMLDRCYFLARRNDHVDIFSNVLRPRSKKYVVFNACFELGSIVRGSGDDLAYHAQVSIHDISKLINFFAANGIADLKNFDFKKFVDGACSDLETYISQTRHSNTLRSEGDIVNLYQKFESTLNRIQI